MIPHKPSISYQARSRLDLSHPSHLCLLSHARAWSIIWFGMYVSDHVCMYVPCKCIMYIYVVWLLCGDVRAPPNQNGLFFIRIWPEDRSVRFTVCEPLCIMYKVVVLGVFEYFLSLYHFVSIFLSFPFLISNKSLYFTRVHTL